MPLYEYSKWDGSQVFSPQSAEDAFDQLAEYLMDYGDQVFRELDRVDPEDEPELLKLIQREGLIDRDENGKWRVTPKGIRRIQESALNGLFQAMRPDGVGRHDTPLKGEGTLVHEDSRPYVYGDPLANLNLHETIKNAMVRQGGGVPLKIRADDYVVHETEYQTRCATVVLVDMSGSMSRYGKYAATKKVALALGSLLRNQYPQDTLQYVGFYSFASVMTERELLNSAPKQVSLFDSRVFLRYDLDKPTKGAPQHFTNIDAGLKLARGLLARRAAANKQIIIITDGEPTAHIEGREVILIYPPAERTAKQTLNEARRCASAGISVSSFALVEDYFYFGLVNFVQEMARVTKGVAAYCTADDLGKYVFESFTGGRHVKRAAR